MCLYILGGWGMITDTPSHENSGYTSILVVCGLTGTQTLSHLLVKVKHELSYIYDILGYLQTLLPMKTAATPPYWWPVLTGTQTLSHPMVKIKHGLCYIYDILGYMVRL